MVSEIDPSKITWRAGRRVAIIGGGPGGLSAALSLCKAGYDVRLFEQHASIKPIGGAVLLNIPVLMILRSYGVDIQGFSAPGVMWFGSGNGREWADLATPPELEKISGITGFTHGVLRSSAMRRMFELLPPGVLVPNQRLADFTDNGASVDLKFDDGSTLECDMLIGADGVRSIVSRKLFGDPNLFHLGIKVWLAHTDDDGSIPRDRGRAYFKPRHQVSLFPMLDDEGRPGFEWWVVEPHREGDPRPADPHAYLAPIVKGVAGPVEGLLKRTPVENIYQWDIYNRANLSSWSRGRVMCIGDAVHPVSPYAGYGMGMAIEDGYFLGKLLAGEDLNDTARISRRFAEFESIRVGYVNKHVEHARGLGKLIHKVPHIVGVARNAIFERTNFMRKNLQKGYLDDAHKETYDLKELHVA